MHEHEGKSSIGFEENVVAVASYFGFLGLIVLMIEKRSHFVRFHALQSTLGFGILAVFWLCVKWIPALSLLWWAPGLMALIFALAMMHKAYFGDEHKFPIIGSLAFNTIYETGPEHEDLLAPAAAESADGNEATEGT